MKVNEKVALKCFWIHIVSIEFPSQILPYIGSSASTSHWTMKGCLKCDCLHTNALFNNALWILLKIEIPFSKQFFFLSCIVQCAMCKHCVDGKESKSFMHDCICVPSLWVALSTATRCSRHPQTIMIFEVLNLLFHHGRSVLDFLDKKSRKSLHILYG